MNWEAIGAVGEILSAMGVVVTLGYLAVQIRQSNAIASWETHRSAVAGFSDAFQNIANDADNARVYRCGLFDLQSLAPDDRLRFRMLHDQLFFGWQAIFSQHPRHPRVPSGFIKSTFRQPGGQQYWEKSKHRFSPEFVAFVDSCR